MSDRAEEKVEAGWRRSLQRLERRGGGEDVRALREALDPMSEEFAAGAGRPLQEELFAAELLGILWLPCIVWKSRTSEWVRHGKDEELQQR